MQFCALFYLRSVAVCLRPTGRGMCYLNQPRSCGFRKNPKNGRQQSLGPVVSWLGFALSVQGAIPSDLVTVLSRQVLQCSAFLYIFDGFTLSGILRLW